MEIQSNFSFSFFSEDRTKMPAGTVEVEVIKGHGLNDVEFFGYSLSLTSVSLLLSNFSSSSLNQTLVLMFLIINLG